MVLRYAIVWPTILMSVYDHVHVLETKTS